MRKRLANILALGVKELYSIRADPVMLVLIIYTFSLRRLCRGNRRQARGQ